MNDELGVAIDTRLGIDTDGWTEIPLLSTMKLLIAQASSRFTVGAPLCKTPSDDIISFAY